MNSRGSLICEDNEDDFEQRSQKSFDLLENKRTNTSNEINFKCTSL